MWSTERRGCWSSGRLLTTKRLHVNYYIGYPVELVADQKPRSCGEIVRVLNGHLRVDFEVKLDMILKASVTRVNLLNAFNAGRGQGHVPNALDPLPTRHGIHEFIACVSHDVQCGEKYDQPYCKSTPMICGGKMLGIIQCECQRE